MDVGGRRVLVMGLGRSGRAAARLAAAKGAQVVGIDLRSDLDPIDGVTIELGPHRAERFHEADLIVVSPGIPLTQPDLAEALGRGTPVVGELGFAASFLEQPMIAVTGTNGKSTVTWFTHQLLKQAGRRSFVGGNLGNPLSNAVLAEESPEILVVEVSSYQLELPRVGGAEGQVRPDVAVILNLTPDHLERHGTMEAYGAAKARLFERMGPAQFALVPTDDALLERASSGTHATRAWLGAHPGVVRQLHRAHVALGEVDAVIPLDDLGVPGAHNLDNAATAALLVLAVGLHPDVVAAGIGALRPLPHRMEVVSHRHGVRWINDSKATNLDAARAGIGGLEGCAVVLLGGQGKPLADGSLGFGALAPVLSRHRAVICFGEAGPRIAAELHRAGIDCIVASGLEPAADLAAERVRPGDSVLLSPGCASFDAFNDFEHRGRVFAELARREGP